MAPSLDSIQTASGALAVVGSLVVMAALAMCPVWRSRLYPVKWILAVISIFNFFTAANYLYNPGGNLILCEIQASIMQFFEICGTLYALIMALETFILVDAVRQHKRIKDHETIQRHVMYHLAIIAFGISTTVAMFMTDTFGKSGKWCWITKDSYRLYLGYLPIWISVIGVAILDVSVVRTMIESAKELRRLKANKKKVKTTESNDNNNSRKDSEGSADTVSWSSKNSNATTTTTATAATTPTTVTASEPEVENIMEAKMRGVFLRMLFYPLFLLLLFVPGSVTRLAELTNSGDPYVLEFFSICQRFCDPAKGTLNAIMWVFSDADVRRELSSSLRKAVPARIWWIVKSTAAERSAMVSDDMELSSSELAREGMKPTPFSPFESSTVGESTTAYGHAETKFQIMSENTMERISEEYRYDDV